MFGTTYLKRVSLFTETLCSVKHLRKLNIGVSLRFQLIILFRVSTRLLFISTLYLKLQYLIVAKGDVILAVIFNPLLFTLRGARNGFTLVTSQIMRKVYPASQDNFGTLSPEEVPSRVSAKENVARKWGSG